MSEGFRQCGCCKKSWGSLAEFLADPKIYYLGIMAGARELVFLFHHSECGTSVSLSSDMLDAHFVQLNDGRSQEAP